MTRWWVLIAAGLLAACGPEYPNCDDDDDCHEGEFCVNGQCQLCRDNADCPAGQECNGGRCDPIQGFCESNGDCGPGQECQNNRCIATQTEELPPPEDPGPTACSLQTVQFDFDSDSLSSSARDAIASNARCIQERGMQRVHLTGHTDPRGTEEYNLALGDRRARSVMRYITSLGVDQGALSASSMGEEMARGTDEGSWFNDRKVTFTER